MKPETCSAMSDTDRERLKACFTGQRRRIHEAGRLPRALKFDVKTEHVFHRDWNGRGSLGINFVDAMQSHTLVDVGPVPQPDGFRGNRRWSQLQIEQRMSEGGIGAVVWNCGRSMCRVLSRLPECPGGKFRPGVRLLELGCGTGVVGMACWLRGAASVTMTDIPQLLPLVRANLLANFGNRGDAKLPEGITLDEHVWGSDARRFGSPFDVVVGSDCLYDVDALPGLLRTLLAVTDHNSVIYLVYKRRLDNRERPFFNQLQEHYSSVAFSNCCETPPEWRGHGLHVCRITAKKLNAGGVH